MQLVEHGDAVVLGAIDHGEDGAFAALWEEDVVPGWLVFVGEFGFVELGVFDVGSCVGCFVFVCYGG